MLRRLAQTRVLEPEHPSTIGPSEQRLRRVLAVGYRLALAIFVASQLFDFLFSSVWMHGYIWSLNLPVDLDMSDKSAGAIVYHQLKQVGHTERLHTMAVQVFAIALLLMFCGFASGTPQSVWRLFRISVCVGVLASFIRPMQLKHRFFSSLHESFYCLLVTFCVGLILTVKPLERQPSTNGCLQSANAEITTNKNSIIDQKQRL